MIGLTLFLCCAASFAIALAGTRFLIGALSRGRIMDLANDRSSHDAPRPRGGGIAIVAAITLSAAPLLWLGKPLFMLALAPFVALALLSWQDDRRSLPPMLRLAGHALAVLAGMAILWLGASAQHGGWIWLIVPVMAFCWLWFVNAFNFMDGIDGIAGVEAVTIGLGAGLLGWMLAVPGAGAGLVMAAAAFGFLVFNWPPSRIFMGDVGSISLGWFSGFLLCWLVWNGAWAAALLLPMYFLADASLTLLGRIWRGENISEAHRLHWYQRAAGRSALGHRRVLTVVIATNIALLMLAVASAGAELPIAAICVGAGILLCIACLATLQTMAASTPHAI